ncbi:hypothetical protein QYF36_014885 [Acer negundo]|nr:hypothetical protein QYF36_014885 [Acer negundo]
MNKDGNNKIKCGNNKMREWRPQLEEWKSTLRLLPKLYKVRCMKSPRAIRRRKMLPPSFRMERKYKKRRQKMWRRKRKMSFFEAPLLCEESMPPTQKQLEHADAHQNFPRSNLASA